MSLYFQKFKWTKRRKWHEGKSLCFLSPVKIFKYFKTQWNSVASPEKLRDMENVLSNSKSMKQQFRKNKRQVLKKYKNHNIIKENRSALKKKKKIKHVINHDALDTNREMAEFQKHNLTCFQRWEKVNYKARAIVFVSLLLQYSRRCLCDFFLAQCIVVFSPSW